MIMKQLDKLSQTLQDPNLSALESYELAKMTVNTLKQDRNDTSLELLYETFEQLQKRYDTDEATVPRKRSRPSKITDNGKAASSHFPFSPREF